MKHKILIIEDDFTIQTQLKTLLSGNGYEFFLSNRSGKGFRISFENPLLSILGTPEKFVSEVTLWIFFGITSFMLMIMILV